MDVIVDSLRINRFKDDLITHLGPQKPKCISLVIYWYALLSDLCSTRGSFLDHDPSPKGNS